MGKEVVVGDPAVGGAQQLMDIVALDLDHRFVGPLAEIEEPSAEDLFGGQALIASVAAEFGGEVLGQSLHWADAALVEDIDAAHFVGSGAGQSLRGARGRAKSPWPAGGNARSARRIGARCPEPGRDSRCRSRRCPRGRERR